jgi:hypothetical protein
MRADLDRVEALSGSKLLKDLRARRLAFLDARVF